MIEVADSSLALDRHKATIYAAAGVPVYWIINLPDRCVEIYVSTQVRDGNARYAEPRFARGNDEIDIVIDGVIAGRIRCSQIFG